MSSCRISSTGPAGDSRQCVALVPSVLRSRHEFGIPHKPYAFGCDGLDGYRPRHLPYRKRASSAVSRPRRGWRYPPRGRSGRRRGDGLVRRWGLDFWTEGSTKRWGRSATRGTERADRRNFRNDAPGQGAGHLQVGRGGVWASGLFVTSSRTTPGNQTVSARGRSGSRYSGPSRAFHARGAEHAFGRQEFLGGVLRIRYLPSGRLPKHHERQRGVCH